VSFGLETMATLAALAGFAVATAAEADHEERSLHSQGSLRSQLHGRQPRR
jgi:hypothetical protein